jgi:hypothetical protein
MHAAAADDAPLRRFVMRSASFSKDDFDKLLASTGMFNGQLECLLIGSVHGNVSWWVVRVNACWRC